MKNGAFFCFEANLKKSGASPIIIKNINQFSIFSINEFDKRKDVANVTKNTS